MSRSAAQRWRRLLQPLGALLCLSGVLLYGFEYSSSAYYHLLHQAEEHYQAQRYPEAIEAYQRVLERAQALDIRLGAVLLNYFVSTDRVRLQIANSHYRLAEVELRHFQEAARGSRVTPRPSLATMQRLLTVARNAYDAVPQRQPRTSIAAHVNATRTAAWQLILAAFSEQTSGRRSISHQASQTIKRAARAVDLAHQHEALVSRQEYMTALLLLETLTAFSKEAPAPRPPESFKTIARGRLGDLLRQKQPELSARARERFRQFFFALPFEANDPWPRQRRGGAGGGQRPVAH